MKRDISYLAFCALLLLASCNTPPRQPVTNPTQADLQKCEAITHRILDSPDNDAALIHEVYEPSLASRIQRGQTAKPGTPRHLNYDYVYETQFEMPEVLQVGPANADAYRVYVPVVLQWANETPATKYWVFASKKGRWMVVEMIDTEGRRLSQILK